MHHCWLWGPADSSLFIPSLRMDTVAFLKVLHGADPGALLGVLKSGLFPPPFLPIYLKTPLFVPKSSDVRRVLGVSVSKGGSAPLPPPRALQTALPPFSSELLTWGCAKFQLLMNCFLPGNTKHAPGQSMAEWLCGNFLELEQL